MCREKKGATMEQLSTTQTATDSQLINQFITELDTTSKCTMNSYKWSIQKYMRYIAVSNEDPKEAQTVRNYKKYLLESGMKVSTVNLYIAAVKRFYGFLEEHNLCENVAKKIKKERETKNFKKDALTLDQVKMILNSIDTSTLKGKRNRALFMLMVNTGLRTIEINRAVVGDIRNVGNKEVLYIQGKGHTEKDEFVVLNKAVQHSLNEYLAARKDVEDASPLFECTGNRASGTPLTTKSISHIIKGLFKENGLVSERLTAHSTRHTACTIALMNGADLQEVQQMARHTSINTTLIYSHNINRLEHSAEDVLDGLFN